MCRLALTGLEKVYRDRKTEKKAVQDLTVHFEHGVYGLLGENGAGKNYIDAYDCRYFKTDTGTDHV